MRNRFRLLFWVLFGHYPSPRIPQAPFLNCGRAFRCIFFLKVPFDKLSVKPQGTFKKKDAASIANAKFQMQNQMFIHFRFKCKVECLFIFVLNAESNGRLIPYNNNRFFKL